MEKRTSFGIITSYLLLIITAFADPVCAQHIQLENPSFEGTASGKDTVPHGWFKVSSTPDIQPGMFGITAHPSAGQHYVGMHSGIDQVESIGQMLKDSLKAGLLYTMSFDLAYVPAYAYLTCYGNLAIFGGNSPGDSAELLWMSGMFTHETWKRYNATFTPSKSYKYISLWTYPTAHCSKSRAGIALLIDNVSPTIRQTVKTQLSSQPTCNNTNTGAAAIKITGGQAPYQYIWSPGNYKTDSIRNVPAGIYQVTATAANGLIIKEQVTVQQSNLSAQAEVVTSPCYNDNQSQITVNTTGGVPPYRYSLNGDTGSVPVFDKLAPGAYTLIVKDQQVCADTFQLKVQPPPPLLAKLAVTPTACAEDTSGQLIAYMQGGVPPYTYRINNGAWQTDSVFGHLKAGTYQYEVKDDNACSISGTTNVAIDAERQPVVSVATTPIPCNDDTSGQLIAYVQGGVPPYTYRINNGAWQTDSLFHHLKAGAYQYEVKDQQACSITGTANVTIDPSLLPVVNVTVNPASCGEAGNGQLIPHVQGGVAPFEYRINNGAWQTDSLFDQLKTGTYLYEVRDQGLCSVSGTVAVTSPWQNCLVVMPSAFSPNGDGNNDVFRPKVYDNISQYHIRVYNRWGAVIYEGNDPATGWDGTYKGAAQDPQTFIYICAYTDRNNERQEMKGTVTLVR